MSNTITGTMDPVQETQRVISALTTIYSVSSNTSTDRDQANQYLTQFQRNVMAWEISDRLLSMNINTMSTQASDDLMVQTQIYFFAAQTIHTKCRSDMLQLPSSSWISLRESLLHHLTRFCNEFNSGVTSGKMHVGGSYFRPIVSRLAMALCALSVQMQWYDVVDQLVLGLSSNSNANASGHFNIPNEANISLVLEMAQMLPEEATSYRLLVQDKSVRQGFIQGLIDKSHIVFQFFYAIVCQYQPPSSTGGRHDSIISGPDGGAGGNVSLQSSVKIQEQILKCIHAWIRYINIPAKVLQETPLFDWAFSILHSYDALAHNQGDMFELAVDVIIEILRCYPSDSELNVGLVQKMIPLVMALAEQQSQQHWSPFQKALQNQDEDGMRAFCRIFTEMGESYMSLIMHHEDLNQVALVELVLNCSALPDHEIATITLHFWYRFVSWLEEVNPYEFRQYLIDNFTTQIIKLVSTCASLLQYPTDIEELPKDRIDDINRVRFSVCDTVEDCCRLLGGDIVLQKIGEKLQEEIQRLSSLPQQEQRLLQWHGIESCLLAIKSAFRYIPSDEAQVLPFVMNLLPDLPTSVTYLRSTANHVVAGYASWLTSHPDTLRPILPFLAQGLSEPKCASSAALAIKNLCQNCTASMSLGDNVLQLYDGILNAQQQHNNSVLDIKDELEVLEGVCIAVSRQLNDMAKKVTTEQECQTLAETIATYVTKIVGPIGSKLVQFIEPSSTAGPKQAVAEIERLTVVIRCLNLPDPKEGAPTLASRAKLIVDLMTQCWAWLDHLSQKFITDINLAEKLCRLHKHCIRGCGGNLYKPLFEKLRGQLVTNFSRSHLSPYLYAVSIIISEYGKDPSFEQHLFQTFEAMSNSAFEVLRSFDDFRDRPDVVEELLYLAVRMIEFCPQLFVSNQLFHSFLQCAVVGMKQDHRDANRGALHFLEYSFGYGKNLRNASSDDAVALACRESLEKAVATEGQQIITNSILALTGELPCYRVACSQGSIAGILYETNILCPNLLMEWLKSPLESVQEGAKSMLMDVFRFTDQDYFFETIERFAKICDEAQTLGR